MAFFVPFPDLILRNFSGCLKTGSPPPSGGGIPHPLPPGSPTRGGAIKESTRPRRSRALVKKWQIAYLIACLVMVANHWLNPELRSEIDPVALMMLGLLVVALRSPYRPLCLWDWPLFGLSLTLCGSGAWLFTPRQEGGFRMFFAAYMTLADGFGLSWTASARDRRWFKEVLEPTRKFSHFSLPMLDIGLALAPFAFPLLALRYQVRRRSSVEDGA